MMDWQFTLLLLLYITPTLTLSYTTKIDSINRRNAITTTFKTAAAAATTIASTTTTSTLPSFAAEAAAAPTGTTNNKVILPGSKSEFPLASFGLQIYNDDTAYKLTSIALEVGYRNFFASVLAGNQKGFAKAIKDSNIPLSELYICGTVLSNRAKGFDAAYKQTKKGCLENLDIFSKYGNISKLNMIMLDYPGPDKESIQGQWKAFLDFQSDLSVVDLAVSNFNAAQLDAVLTMDEVIESKVRKGPCVNQLPYSVAYHPQNLIEYNRNRGVLVQSWSPLSRVLGNPNIRPVLSSIGNQYGKSAAQVALRWIIQSGSGAGFSTQSKKQSHFKEDIQVFDFELTEKEMDELTKLIPS